MCSQGVVPTAACDTNISPVVGWGPEERKKKMEDKNYTWESSGRWCLNGLPTSCSYFLYFAMQSSLPIILHLHSTCCLWRMPRVLWQVHNPTSHVSCMCSFCGPPFHTIHPTHSAKASETKKGWHDVPQITPLLGHLLAHSRASTHAQWLYVNAYVKL